MRHVGQHDPAHKVRTLEPLEAPVRAVGGELRQHVVERRLCAEPVGEAGQAVGPAAAAPVTADADDDVGVWGQAQDGHGASRKGMAVLGEKDRRMPLLRRSRARQEQEAALPGEARSTAASIASLASRRAV